MNSETRVSPAGTPLLAGMPEAHADSAEMPTPEGVPTSAGTPLRGGASLSGGAPLVGMSAQAGASPAGANSPFAANNTPATDAPFAAATAQPETPLQSVERLVHQVIDERKTRFMQDPAGVAQKDPVFERGWMGGVSGGMPGKVSKEDQISWSMQLQQERCEEVGIFPRALDGAWSRLGGSGCREKRRHSWSGCGAFHA